VAVHADLVLMAEQAGRQEAVRRGLRVAGTLSVLDDAEQAGLSTSIAPPLSFKRPASAFRRVCSQK
jgi:predicted nucleic acid-binding protein